MGKNNNQNVRNLISTVYNVQSSKSSILDCVPTHCSHPSESAHGGSCRCLVLQPAMRQLIILLSPLLELFLNNSCSDRVICEYVITQVTRIQISNGDRAKVVGLTWAAHHKALNSSKRVSGTAHVEKFLVCLATFDKFLNHNVIITCPNFLPTARERTKISADTSIPTHVSK